MAGGTRTSRQMVPGSKREEHFNPRTRLRHAVARSFKVLVFLATIVGVVVLAVLLIDVVIQGYSRLSLDFLRQGSSSTPENAGIYSGIIGSLWLMGLTFLISVPLGIAAAVYLEEYAGDNWINRIIEINISNLAGVPSVIYGLLALGIFVNYLGSITGGKSLISGAMALSLLILPVIIIATREAVRSVPGKVREGAYALGATRWEVVRDHVLPMSLPGALTGVILAISRALGETAPLIVVGAATFMTFTPDGPRSSFTALPMQIYDYVKRPQEAFKEEIAAAGIIVLMVVLLLMNSTAIILRNRWQRRG